jgi:hypothetical protein
MGFTYINIYQGKNAGANRIAAYMPGVSVEMAKAATQIGMVADGLLTARHGKTKHRFHNLPAPQIRVTKGKKLDWYIMLEASGGSEGDALQRAIGIEFGHNKQSKEKNASGPWGQSGGLHVLEDAVGLVGFFRYAGARGR